jgi:hypothetical protein
MQLPLVWYGTAIEGRIIEAMILINQLKKLLAILTDSV